MNSLLQENTFEKKQQFYQDISIRHFGISSHIFNAQNMVFK